MIITEQILDQGKSAIGGWRAKQLRHIIPADEYEQYRAFPKSGWRKRILGLDVPKEQIERFLSSKKTETGNLFA